MRGGWALLTYYAAYYLAFGILSLPVFIVLEVRHSDPEALLPLVTPFLGTFAGLAVSAVALKGEGRPFRNLGFTLGSRWFKEFGLGIAVGALLVGASALVLRGAGGFNWKVDPAGSLRSLGFGFLFFLAVGLNEEIAFRGYPLQRLVKGLGIWPAVIGLALPFALLHLANPAIASAGAISKIAAVSNVALLGILLGLWCIRTQSLALPVGLHLGWNWVQGSVMGFGVSGVTLSSGLWTPVMHDRPLWLTGGTIGIEGSAACTLTLAVAIGVLVFGKRASPWSCSSWTVPSRSGEPKAQAFTCADRASQEVP